MILTPENEGPTFTIRTIGKGAIVEVAYKTATGDRETKKFTYPLEDLQQLTSLPAYIQWQEEMQKWREGTVPPYPSDGVELSGSRRPITLEDAFFHES